MILGDGECAEGSVWEAAALADRLQTTNLVAILDANRLGQSGESLHGHDVGRWVRKFGAFGWHVFVVDGHSVREILAAFESIRKLKGPSIIIAKTFKGKGVSFIEDKEGWHGKVLKPEELILALKELGPLPKVISKDFVKRPLSKVRGVSPKSYKLQTTNYKPVDKVATREAYGSMLKKLGADPRVVALDADVKNSTFSERFKEVFPNRFVDCFIAEQNMVGMAVGLSAKGFVPFVSTFAAFLSRAHDQIRMAGISGSNVKLCGSHVGVSIGEDGPSQMGLEDLALMRSVPGSVVLYPSDAVSAEACTSLLAGHKGIGYLRTSRPKTDVLYGNNESFKIGGCKVLKSGSKDKAVVIAAGITVHEALKASKVVPITVIDAYSVKPLDEKTIRKACKGRKVIVVEDHYAEGGLGEAVSALGIPIVHLCVKAVPRSGKPEELLSKFKLDSSAIVDAVRK